MKFRGVKRCVAFSRCIPSSFDLRLTPMLDSISLFLEEPPVFGGEPLSSFLKMHFSKYRPAALERGEEVHSQSLSLLPEVFQRKLTAYSRQYFEEVNEQNRLADLIRYNFSHGLQVSLREIFRHPMLEFVPPEFLPSAEMSPSAFHQWSLLDPELEAIPEVQRLAEFMQSFLARLSELHRQRKIEIYLQTPSKPDRAIKLTSIEYDPVREVDWRVEFQEKAELESDFALVNFRKQPLHFYRSFALESTEGVLLIHPWKQELTALQEQMSLISESLFLRAGKMPSFQITGELEAKAMLKYLRSRQIPVKITGETRVLRKNQSRLEIRLEESGRFYIQHEARVLEQKNLVRKGWTSRTTVFLQTLMSGLSYLLGVEPKDIASRLQTHRDWDLKLLKNLGILQFVFFETLYFHFERTLSDGTAVTPETLFSELQPRTQKILIAGAGESFVRTVPLNQLCSRPVLACMDEFVKNILNSVQASEAFYSENGEVILEGVIEREFRLIFELLRATVPGVGGVAVIEHFKKSRKAVIEKCVLEPSFHGLSTLPATLERLQSLIPLGFTLFLNEQPLQQLGENDLKIDFVLRSDGDARFFNWFELSPQFFLRGEEVSPERILKLGAGGVVEYQNKYYTVPSDQWPTFARLEDFWWRLQKGKVETTKKKNGEVVYQLPRHQALELLALRASGIPIRGDENWKALCKFYDELGQGQRELKIPDSVTAELKPYQKIGTSWLLDLYNLRFGALLADDMGLGKTLQALTFLDVLRADGKLGPVLIVVPSSLVFNWQEEAAKFTPSLSLEVFSKDQDTRLGRKLAAKDNVVIIATYGLLLEHNDFLNQFQWNVVIFDEAQNLKNISTKRTSAARSLMANFKIAMTGTPMENHYGEFYSLIDLLVPGSLGPLEDFRRKFVNTEMVTREEMDELKLRIKPLLLRRTKREILDQLPEMQETKVRIAFEEEQKEIYRNVALSYNNRIQETIAIDGHANIQLQMLTALLRLRQVCSDPAALPNVEYNKIPPKLDTLRDSLKEIVESGESALVFTQFLKTLEHTQHLLEEAGLKVFSLHGGVPAKQRQKLLADFTRTEGGAVLLMTLKTGGVGLNLTKASYIFHIEPWWNPSVENQAVARAHRLGQTKAVQVFKYIMHESLEEKIEELQARKERKFDVLLSQSETESETDLSADEKIRSPAGSGLTKQDFDHLLSLGDLWKA